MKIMLESYRDLKVWQKAIDMVVGCYEISRRFPKDEIYGLTSQLRRAAVSVPVNIAEGYGRGSRKEYLQFLTIAQGSLKEVETHLIIAQRLDYLTQAQLKIALTRSDEIGKMLGSLIRSLKEKI
jgi:four helix bundle protein